MEKVTLAELMHKYAYARNRLNIYEKLLVRCKASLTNIPNNKWAFNAAERDWNTLKKYNDKYNDRLFVPGEPDIPLLIKSCMRGHITTEEVSNKTRMAERIDIFTGILHKDEETARNEFKQAWDRYISLHGADNELYELFAEHLDEVIEVFCAEID